MKTMKNQKNLFSLGAGLSFAFLAFFAPSVAFSADVTIEDVDVYTLTEDAYGVLSLVDVGGYTYNSDTYSAVTSRKTGLGANSTTNGIFTYTYSSTSTYGGAVNNANANLTINGAFIGSSATASKNASAGGAVSNSGGSFTAIAADFYNNYAKASSSTASGGAIFNNASGVINAISGDFVGNYAQASTTANGGAIYNTNEIYNLEGSFYYNYAQGATANGGAVSNTDYIEFIAQTKDTAFFGNYTLTTDEVKTSNAIYNTGTVCFNTYNSKTISVYDGINGTTDGSTTGLIYINSDADGGANSTVGFYNKVENQTITVSAGTLALGSVAMSIDGTTSYYSADLSSSSLTVSSGATLSFVVNAGSNEALNAIVLGTTTIESGAILELDLSAIYGSFSLTISTSTELSDLALDIIFADDSIEGLSFTAGDYDVSSYEALDSLSISYEGSVYTIEGSVVGTAVPEPSTYAMIFGVVALGFAAYRRRK